MSAVECYVYGRGRDIPRYKWSPYDPVLVGEALYAYAVILAFLKLMYFFQIGHELGSLQVSISWMMRDILRFLVVFFVIMLSFSVGMHMLYHHYKGWTGLINGQEGTQDPSFSTFRNTVRTLYWAIYGYSPPNYADIVVSEYYEKHTNGTVHKYNHHSFTQAMGQGIFALYYIAGIIIMFNMLIAMMSTSFSSVQSNADIEWKFARARVWMSYFEEGNTLPPPYNLVPSPKSLWRALTWCGRKLIFDPTARCSTKTLMVTLIQRYLTHQGRRNTSSPLCLATSRSGRNYSTPGAAFSNRLYDILEEGTATVSNNYSDTSLASGQYTSCHNVLNEHFY